MAISTDVVSKVLVKDSSAEALAKLKEYFKCKGLVGLCVRDESVGLLDLLAANTDLGAVFLADDIQSNGLTGIELACQIKKLRPELPIFVRKQHLTDEDTVIKEYEVFTLFDFERLSHLLEQHLFTKFYPIELIRGIQEISEQAFKANILDANVEVDSPYLIKDQIIYGELFSLIPLESNWCRGYMTLQTTTAEVIEIIKAGHTFLDPQSTNFRDINNLFNEITNLMWGGIKARLLNYGHVDEETTARTQVPIMVNHQEKYISFGSNEPQLCFRYTIESKSCQSKKVYVYQKIIFNLDWKPELFTQQIGAVEDMVDSGELELF